MKIIYDALIKNTYSIYLTPPSWVGPEVSYKLLLTQVVGESSSGTLQGVLWKEYRWLQVVLTRSTSNFYA